VTKQQTFDFGGILNNDVDTGSFKWNFYHCWTGQL